jgi:indolepyruvate ferredoxin oxidoreductase alpha subunit
MHSSQNEQDNRIFARFAQIHYLEPADSQEAKDFVRIAYEISEEFDIPVMLHMSTRISHTKGVVLLGEPMQLEEGRFTKDPAKYVMVPANARKRHIALEERLERLREYSENTPLNFVENNGSKIGIIAGGPAYQYAKEIVPDLDYFKIGFGNPLPIKKLTRFLEDHERVIVVEELEPFYEEQLKAAGLVVEGKKHFGRRGEFTPYRVAVGLKEAGIIDEVKQPDISAETLFPRPPVLCPGCPHRGAFMALKKLRVAVTGDIGCYTLGYMKPLNALDTCICMGASIGNAIGMEKVKGSEKGTVAVIGDSTFFHSGITGLLDAVYNQSNVTVMILDNRATAMTGGQTSVGGGRFEEICVGLGVARDHVRTIIPLPRNHDENVKVLREEIVGHRGVSVVIARRECIQTLRRKKS